MVRRLRIAASVFFALLTVALAVLWVRSYYHCETVVYVGNQWATFAGSNSGIVDLVYSPFRSGQNVRPLYGDSGWRCRTTAPSISGDTFNWSFADGLVIQFPYWSITSVTTILAAAAFAPWTKKRFSLRTMLIATTVVALIVGAVVTLSR